MKFKLLPRSIWGDYDVYVARKKGYVVEIRTPYSRQSRDYGMYTYFIKMPSGEMKTSIRDNNYFNSFSSCSDWVIGWVDGQLKSMIN